MIASEELKELLHYNKETGIFTWRVKVSRKIRVGQRAECFDPVYGYILIRVKGRLYRAHRLAWLYVYGVWPTKDLDHENQVKTNNWISNLRGVTCGQNQQNKGKYKNNTSGYKGVYFFKRDKNWTAQIAVQGKSISLGYFPTPELAHEAYTAAQVKYHSHRPNVSSPLSQIPSRTQPLQHF